MKANETFAAEMYRIGDKEHYKADRKLFVKNLGDLLSQTGEQILSAELDDNDIVTIHFEGGDKKVNVAMDSYTAIIKDVLKAI